MTMCLKKFIIEICKGFNSTVRPLYNVFFKNVIRKVISVTTTFWIPQEVLTSNLYKQLLH